MQDSTIISKSWKGILVAKLDSLGKVGWARSVGGTWFNHGHGIAVDGKNNCYVTGTFEGTATYGKKELVARAKDLFVARLDTTGAVQWYAATSGQDTSERFFNSGEEIVADDQGAHVLGRITHTNRVVTSAGDSLVTSRGLHDVVLFKIVSNLVAP